MNNWYKANSAGHQGLVCDEITGRNVAVTYDINDADLVAAAPEMLKALQTILYAHDNHGNGAAMGEAVLCRTYADQVRWADNLRALHDWAEHKH